MCVLVSGSSNSGFNNETPLTGVVLQVCFGESLREFPRDLFDAERGARSAIQTFILHPDVPHVPHEPPGQAGEQEQRAGVNEKIPVKHVIPPHVTEYPDEEQDQTDDVEDDRQDE